MRLDFEDSGESMARPLRVFFVYAGTAALTRDETRG